MSEPQEPTGPEPTGPEPTEAAPGAPRRRAFLRGALGAGAAGAVAGVAGGYAYRATRPASAGEVALENAAAGLLPPVPFHGAHQAGILPQPQRQTAVIAFNATAEGRAELVDLFQAITARAGFLTAGGTPPPVGIAGPPSDSGVLGPTVVPDGLTVTVGVGSTLFDDRYGLADRLPAGLTPMLPFPNDDLDPAQVGGDLVVQLSGGNADVVMHALRDIARHTRGGMQALWRIDGFSSPPRPSGTVSRNMLGFMDGISNPDTADQAEMDRLVWIQPGTAGEPAWTAGGSYFVVRLIRMLVEFWDRVDITEQENMIGRRRATGYPLDATSIFATPDYAQDPEGAVIPLTAHMRLANPRTPQTAGSRILRRAYNYDRGIDQVGNLDIGLVFTCFQQDIKRQFEAVQTRLIGEPLVDYISPFGGGYFLALPGVTDGGDYLARGLLA
ncbi:MAG TPA: Dyp-type peroxidase [Streptosporangiaceae bacterium]|nr:Dyp-type peroxidase [Streptosporangiaceae bacterium]